MPKIHRPRKHKLLAPPSDIPRPEWVDFAALADGVNVDEAWAVVWETVSDLARTSEFTYEQWLDRMGANNIQIRFPYTHGRLTLEYEVEDPEGRR